MASRPRGRNGQCRRKCTFLDACTGAAILDPVRKAKDAGNALVGAGTKVGATRATKASGQAAPQEKRAGALRTADSPRRARKPPPPLPPEELLDRAMKASTPRSRALWARRGLAHPGKLDRTTKTMLLRQLYLALYEERRFLKAAEIADQIVSIAVLPDVAHQDAARARQSLGEIEVAAGHLRLAARVGPANRKAFHWWTLGSLYFLAHRYDDAISALTRASRWGTTDKPLYQGHLAIARCAKGEAVEDLGVFIDRLVAVPAGQGYGRFVLGQLAFYDRRWAEARRYLESFVTRTLGGRAAMTIALEGEIEVARRTLSSLTEG
jgi:tetratricopeptide (TPR) repeat protein